MTGQLEQHRLGGKKDLWVGVEWGGDGEKGVAGSQADTSSAKDDLVSR